eukprot:TRINITY_DN32619_c0_g1_i1.p1 TRINITY_DN32619_c0_g1~~TRINITY_DN32619_c0_g1_i1.p1  ORF type:complete len:129 (-),score=20.87 TRINITY_DN32619_c0_g1_i1:113-499(-)
MQGPKQVLNENIDRKKYNSSENELSADSNERGETFQTDEFSSASKGVIKCKIKTPPNKGSTVHGQIVEHKEMKNELASLKEAKEKDSGAYIKETGSIINIPFIPTQVSCNIKPPPKKASSFMDKLLSK